MLKNIDFNSKLSKNDILIILTIILGVFLFLGLTGNLDNAYHFTDDHEIIRISHDLQAKSVFPVIYDWIKTDLDIRYRPIFYVNRVLEVRLFGEKFILWSIWNAILASASFVFFYFGMRRLDFSKIESILFVLLAFLGPQMAIWWRLGTNETIGVFFLGLAFYFIPCCNKRYRLNTFIFSIFLIFAMLSKESFLIISPVLILYKLLDDKKKTNDSMKELLNRNLLLIIPLIVFLMSIWLIVFEIGTNEIGYAGLSKEIGQMAKGIIRIINYFLVDWEILIILCLFLVYYELKVGKELWGFAQKMLIPAIFAILIILPNLIIYAESGMGERYLLPSTIGLSYFLVSILRNIYSN